MSFHLRFLIATSSSSLDMVFFMTTFSFLGGFGTTSADYSWPFVNFHFCLSTNNFSTCNFSGCFSTCGLVNFSRVFPLSIPLVVSISWAGNCWLITHWPLTPHVGIVLKKSQGSQNFNLEWILLNYNQYSSLDKYAFPQISKLSWPPFQCTPPNYRAYSSSWNCTLK